jgi:hypothetical protein
MFHLKVKIMAKKNAILNYSSSVGKVHVNGKTISEKTCKHCGKTFPLADWRLTMGFDFVWKCECPACKEVSVGL